MSIENITGTRETLFARHPGAAQTDRDAAAPFRTLLERASAGGDVTAHLESRARPDSPAAEARRQEIEAVAAMHSKVQPMMEDIGAELGQLRRAFADAGMPIVDMVKFSKTPTGEFRVGGWGIGREVSHPQSAFIEAVMNGKAPGFEELSRQVNDIVGRIDDIFAGIQDIQEDQARATGAPFERRASYFDGDVVMSTEHLNDVGGAARKLAGRDPAAFRSFRQSLGSELDYLTERQVLSRFHFSEMGRNGLDARFDAFFDKTG